MRDTGCPPFLDVLSCLICIVLSFAMIGYLLLWLSLAEPQTVPLNVFVFFMTFGVMIVYCFFEVGAGVISGKVAQRERAGVAEGDCGD